MGTRTATSNVSKDENTFAIGDSPDSSSSLDSSPAVSLMTVDICNLPSILPPTNFGEVIPGLVFRSNFPAIENFEFLEDMGLKTILTLVPGPYPAEYVDFMKRNQIRHFTVHIPANKRGKVNIRPRDMLLALSIVIDKENYPLLIHCNKGKHRTGCVVACFRRIQGRAIPSIEAEYDAHAGTKGRPEDKSFFKGFEEKPLAVLAGIYGYDAVEEESGCAVQAPSAGVGRYSAVYPLRNA